MSVININIDTDNSAFDGVNRGVEVARILRKIADEYEKGAWISTTVSDINGNIVCDVYDSESILDLDLSEFEDKE